jgi:hypothetical protein
LTLVFKLIFTGAIMQFVGPSIPFLIAGGLKAAYDLALYFMFRNVKPPEEMSVA